MVADLRGSYVQAKDQCDGKAENARAAQDGVDADEQAGGNAPGQPFRRGSHAEQGEDGKDDAAIDPVMVDGSGSLVGVAAIWFVRLHF